SRPTIINEIADLFKRLINECWETVLTKRPTANALMEIFNNWAVNVNDPEACYANRLFNISNLPKLDDLSNLYTQPVLDQ
ncbi:24617_t:CDS:2, partial [Dentiscutata erythropus]